MFGLWVSIRGRTERINMTEPKELSKIIADTASVELQEKFEKGQHEHGGDFAIKPTVKNIREEILDLVNYSHTLVLHRSKIIVSIDKLIEELPSLNPAIIELKLKAIRALVHDL